MSIIEHRYRMFSASKFYTTKLPPGILLYLKKYNKMYYLEDSDLNETFKEFWYDVMQLASAYLYEGPVYTEDDLFKLLKSHNFILYDKTLVKNINEVNDLLAVLKEAIAIVSEELAIHSFDQHNVFIHTLNEHYVVYEFEKGE